MRSDQRILVVSAEAAWAARICPPLAQAGCAVYTAASGRQAWEAALRHRPQLVLIDGRLPAPGSLALGRQLKGDPALPEILVAILGGAAASPAPGEEAGADDCLPDPVDARELVARVGLLLRIADLHEARREQAGALQQAMAGRRQAEADQARAEGEWEKGLRFESLLADLPALFANTPAAQADGRIEQAQHQVCECLGLDASTLWQRPANDSQAWAAIHRYRTPGGPEYSGRLEAAEDLPWCLAQVAAGRKVRLATLAEAPPEAARDRATWHRLGIQSFLALPLVTGAGAVLGGLSFSTVGAACAWPERLVRRLELVARIIADSLAHRHTAGALRDSETRFRCMSENSLAGIYIVQDGRLAYANQALAKIFGYDPGELVGGDPRRLIHPEDQALVLDNLRRRLAGEAESAHYEFRGLSRKGEVVHLEVLGARVDLDGRPAVIGNLLDITGRKRAAEALAESEKRFAAFMLHLPAAAFIKDAAGRTLFANPYLQNLLGLQDWEGKTTPELVGGAAGQKMAEDDLRAIQHGPLKIEETIPDAHGAVRSFETIKFPISLGGKPPLIGGVSVEITERKKSELRQLHFHNLMQYIIAHAQSAIAVHDRDLRYIFVSERYLRDYRVKAHDVIGKHHYEVFPDLPQKWREVHQRALAGEVSSADEDPYVREDGSVDWTRWECRPWYEASGAIGGLIIYTEVITERVRVEKQIRQLSRAVEQSPVSIVITDPAGAIEYVNPKFTQLTGYSLEEARGQNPRLLKGDGTAPEEYRRLWQTITAGGQWRGEFHNRKKSGEMYWEFATLSPILDTQGRITHFLAVKEDITERKILEGQLRQAQKLESIGQLAGGVAHDFNNILAAILIQLSCLEMNPSLDEETKEGLHDLAAEAERAANLTRQLLMFSRRSVLEVRALDLNELAGNLLKMLGRLIGEHISMRFTPRDGLPPVEADPGMLEQVIMNLAVNARDAMPRGGKLTISLEAVQVEESQCHARAEARPGSFVCLTVADTGCGMSEATRQRIFEPFFTTKEIGKGTGLGLATVHGIVGQHKGWIEVDSQPGQGATFRVFLPAASRPAAEPAPPEPIEVTRGHEAILLVEDEVRVRLVTAQGLRLLGYRVFEAANGREALAVWEEHQGEIDLLLTDLVMPEGLTGLDLADQLCRLKPGLKVILSSGYSTEIIDRNSPWSNHHLRLQKPYKLEVLFSAIRLLLHQK